MHSLWNMPRMASTGHLVAVLNVVAPDLQIDWIAPQTDRPLLTFEYEGKKYVANNRGDYEEACPDCDGSGDFVLNPDWPKGDKPYSEKCSTCGGNGLA